MLDAEPAKFTGGGGHSQFHLIDEVAHSSFQGFDKLIYFLIGSLEDQFDAAVGKIADKTADIIAHGQILDGVTEADALDAALKISRAATGR